jgi:hypothetical protein
MKLQEQHFLRHKFFLVFTLVAAFQLPISADDVGHDGISYEIIAEQHVYKANSYATLKLMVTNRGSEPVFISRDIGRCSKWSGHSEIQLLNEKRENVLRGGCDDAEGPIRDADLKSTLNDPNSWIRLFPNEIYGTEEHITLPTVRGLYHLRAELWPPGFPAEQKKLLQQQGLRVLQHSHVAPLLQMRIE